MSAGRLQVGGSVVAGALLRVGSPAARAAAIALALLPVRCSTSAGGLMKVMPLAAQASASSGFSDRKP